ncbi:M1 family metallopeptidase [Candidatus Entotheonella palauensis]|uniref:M1 family metallopeptidase n=1 Tax=Candidatus Entotheonella palauensis TaxID=93172 RepID=UPI0015C4BE98|nr:M1 family metallopeptidase [Candidatus Entotheonella palauensis]
MAEHLDPYRLPQTVVPSRYDIELAPDLDQATFTGSVSIDVEVTEPVETIWLNAAEIDVHTAEIEDASGQRTALSKIVHEAETERLRLDLGHTVPQGAYRLHLSFHGILNDKLRGFYRSVFQDDDGNEHVIATTQFESTDARRAFPCFDEPAFKAVFGVTLIVPAGQFAVSNAPMLDEQLMADGRRKVVFADTMKMSTYLVAFCIGPFEATEPMDVDGVPLRVVHPIGKGHLTDYALQVGAFSLRHFTEYYGIPYPDQKLDLVAIPDFAFGAMENVGCVTFREVLLLIDQQQATQPELMRAADVIAHEIAHMWFGDLVTMRWWNGIWLNEAFATFMATMAADVFNTNWQRWVQFSLDRSAAFEVDSLERTRPIEYPVHSPQDADGMFDSLTYEKGGAVLRMLEQYMGETAFRDGVRHYLNTHQYGNTETNDLWDAMEDVTDEPARRIMDSWIFQRGFPLISIDSDTEGRVTIQQQRFCFTPLDQDTTLWSVPVGLRYGRGGEVAEQQALLESDAIDINLGGDADWIVANAGGHGFYRVRYAPALLQHLTPVMMQQLKPIERYGLVDDTWASVLAGSTSAVDFLEFARGFSNETDLDVWTVLTSCLSQLDRLLDGEARQRYQAVLRELYGPALDRLGWEPRSDDAPRTLELRGLLIRSLAVAGQDQDALAACRRLHAQYLDDRASVEPNIAAVVAAAVASAGSREDYTAFVDRFKHAATPQEERRYQTLLAAFPGVDEMATTLEMTLNGEVRTQDAPYLVAQCMRNREQGVQAWRFMVDNWDQMMEVYPNNAIVRMLDGFKALSKPDIATEIEAFFQTHKVPQGELTLQQHLERLRVNTALREREAASLAAALVG